MEERCGLLQLSVEKKRAVLINTAYIVLLLSAFYLFMKYAFGVLSSFIFAFILGAVLQRPVNAVVKKTPLKKGPVSVLFVLLSVAAVLTVIALAGVKIASEVKGFADTFMAYVGKLPDFVKSVEETLLGIVSKLPEGIGSTLSTTIENFVDKLLLPAEERSQLAQTQQGGSIDILSMLKTPLSGVWATAKQIPNVLVGCLIFVIAACFITSDYDRITSFVKRQLSPQKRRNVTKTKNIVFSSVGKLVKSYALIMLITFVEMCIGLGVLKIIGVYGGNYLFIIATITAIVDIFPVLGTGTVLIPWGVFMLITGRFGMGIGLLVLYVCITVIRQVLEPKVVASNLGIPPIVSIMGMYIGLRLFGVIGIFLLPIMITVLKVLNDEGVVRIWKSAKKSGDEKSEDSKALEEQPSEG